ncbi:unnamed protein product [Parnassius apollo]|uniref:(apollo) hypothetical protein n=1 Tax=Parnassius apollo TaxID=110799 RepID=A0A8S3X6K4_PARAO|nr:unnamed protein product [Parnassius apollo]
MVGAGSLRVQSARALAAGVYTCRAHNRLDSADHSTQLQVLTAPRVTLGGGALAQARARADVTLRCEARGRPPPAVAWLKDGDPLSPNSRDIALLDGTSLRIQGVLRVDAGMFQCAANSIAGSAVAALRLIVLAPGDDSNKSQTSQKTKLPPPKVPLSNTTHDIFNNLVSSGGQDPTLDPTPEDIDFLGETSSAYTSIPDVEYDDAYDSDGDNSFHAAEGLDLDELGQGNASVVSAPKGLKAVIVKHRFVTLSWEEPEHKAEDITGYAVVYKVKGSERERIARGNPQRHEMNVASLQPNTTYQFSVIAFTQHSHSPATEVIEATTAEEELTYGPPQDVRVEALGPHSIRVWWSPPTQTQNGLASTAPPTRYAVYYTDSILVRWEAPPARTHRGPLTGYKVRYRAPGRRAESLTTPADARRAELRGLETGTLYQVRVCAINANGSGPFSEWVSVSTQARERNEARVPSPPPKLTKSNSEYVISLRASNALGLGPAVYATVRTRPALAPDDEPDDVDDPDDPDDVDDPEHEDDQPPLIPPVGLKVIMLSGTTAVVYWTDPTLPKGQTATDGRRYVVRWSTSGGRVRTYNASDLNCMLDDLKPYTTYEFAVKLIKGGREAAWAMLVSNTTLAAAPSSAPRELRVAPAAPPARAADLSWAPPLKQNGPLTGEDWGRRRAGERDVRVAVGERGRCVCCAGTGGRARAVTVLPPPRAAAVTRHQVRPAPRPSPVAYRSVLAAALALSLCCRCHAPPLSPDTRCAPPLALCLKRTVRRWLPRLCCRCDAAAHALPLSPDTSTYQKASASAAIKPPDLWIHHDQMELKHMDKSLHSSAISAGSVDGPNALMSSTLTLARAPPAEYEPARHAPPPASLDRRHYVPTYVGESRPLRSTAATTCPPTSVSPARFAQPPPLRAHLRRRFSLAHISFCFRRTQIDSRRSPSCAGSGSDDTAILRASPASGSSCRRCDRCDYRTMTGVGVGVGVGCAATCERRRHGLPDQSTPLLAGVGPLSSPQSSLASLQHAPHPPHPPHPPPAPCGSGTCPLGAACSVPSGVGSTGSDVYACAARERGHYVAYEPLGHYTHRDSLSSDAGVGGVGGVGVGGAGPVGGLAGGGGGGGAGCAGGSLQRRAACGAPLHSFTLSADGSDHSTPSHSKAGSVRETSPYKKSASSSPGHIPNRLQLGGGVPHCSEELEPLTPSRSTERLHREMQNLEGLMKDLSAITQQQFHC